MGRRKRPTAEEAPQTDAPQKSAVVQQLMARYPGRIFRGDGYTMPWKIRRLPTGVIDLDIALQGGLPAGGLTMITGRESVGKNWLANQVIRRQQELHGENTKIAVVSTELVYDKDQAHGCDVKIPYSPEELESAVSAMRANGVEPTDAWYEMVTSSVGEFLIIPPDTAERNLDIALELIKSREFHVVVIDSFGSMMTEDDEAKTLEEGRRVGGTSGVFTNYATKMNSAYAPDTEGRPNLTCTIGINQVRDNMDRANKYSPATKEAGGWALKHARWVTIEMAPTGKIKEGTKSIGKLVRWEIKKQKAGGHEGATGEYQYIWDLFGPEKWQQLISSAANYGVITQKGSFYSIVHDGQEVKLGQGVKQAAAALEDLGLYDQIYKEVLKAAGIHANYT